MLEIGYNVVVLSLEDYEKLKKQVRDIEAKMQELQKGITFRKSWDNKHIDACISLDPIKDLVENAWEQFEPDKYNGIVKTDFRMTERSNWYGTSYIQMAELIEVPEEEETEDVQQ